MIRPAALALTISLALAGCGKQDVANDSDEIEQALARDDLETNDLTAIDAASAHDANIAADIDPAEFGNADGAVVETFGGVPGRPRQQSQRGARQSEPAGDSNSETPADSSATEPPAESNTAD
jgi:hypothetical protein